MADVNAEYQVRLKELTSQPIDEQAKSFLRAFVIDFQGKFEKVLDDVEEFRTFAKNGEELDEHEAHYFLEKKGEAATVVEFREKMRLIDLDFNKRISITEYLLFRYKKTLKDYFEAKPPVHLIKQLEEAIDKYQAVFREKKEREQKIQELEAIVAEGGPKSAKAKAELMALKSHDSAKDTKNEIGALAAKLKAKRALANPEEEAKRQQEEAFKEEQERLELEKRKKEEEEKKKKEDSKARLKEKAKLWS